MLFLWPSYPCCHCANNFGWSEFAFTDCEGFCAVGWWPHTCLANLLLDCMAEPLFQLSYGVLDILRSLLRHKRLCTGSTDPNPWGGELSMCHTSFISFTVIHSRRVNLKHGPLLEARYCIACILHCAIVIDWLTCHLPAGSPLCDTDITRLSGYIISALPQVCALSSSPFSLTVFRRYLSSYD